MSQDTKNLDREGGENNLQARINAELAEAFKDDPAGACRAHAAITAALAFQPQAGAAVPSVAGASGAGEVKPMPPLPQWAWHDASAERTGSVHFWTADQMQKYAQDYAAAQLDWLREEAADLRAQLARLQAPVGESIDTPEFRQFLAAYCDVWGRSTFPAINEAFGNLIAHIDAQLARQRQDSKPTDLSKRLRELAARPTVLSEPTRRDLVAAADEIEHLAAAQGEPVAHILPADIESLIEHGYTTVFADAVTNSTTGERSVPVYLHGSQQEPVAYADPQAFVNFAAARESGDRRAHMGREWMWANPDAGLVPLYTGTVSAQQEQGDAVRDAALHFADEAINCAFDGGSLDGGTIQEMAEKLGLLKRETMREPCGEGCRCADSVPFFPVECFRKTYRARAILARQPAPVQGSALQADKFSEHSARRGVIIFVLNAYRMASNVEIIADAILAALGAPQAQAAIPMILHCPKCGQQHIDAPDERTANWTNPPHRSHLCHGCGHIWRPADMPTIGVAAIQTRGKNDSPAASRAAVPEGMTKQEKLRALADRIDHEKLWRWAGMDHHKMTPEQKDRMATGVMLRRYSDILEPGRWLVIPPTGSVQFSASTLDKAVEMAKRDEARRTAKGSAQPVAQQTSAQVDTKGGEAA